MKSRFLISMSIILIAGTVILQRLALSEIEYKIIKQEEKVERLQNDIKELKKAIEIIQTERKQ